MQGLADPEGKAKDVDREMVVFYNIVDEGPDGSFLYDRNRESREEAGHKLEDTDKFYTINGAFPHNLGWRTKPCG